MSSKLKRIYPDSQSIVITAVKGYLGNTVHGEELRNDNAVKVVGNLRTFHFTAGE